MWCRAGDEYSDVAQVGGIVGAICMLLTFLIVMIVLCFAPGKENLYWLRYILGTGLSCLVGGPILAVLGLLLYRNACRCGGSSSAFLVVPGYSSEPTEV